MGGGGTGGGWCKCYWNVVRDNVGGKRMDAWWLVEMLFERGEGSYWNETYDWRTSEGMCGRLIRRSMDGFFGD